MFVFMPWVMDGFPPSFNVTHMEEHTRVVGSPPHSSLTKMQRGWPPLCRQRRLIVSCWRMYGRSEEPRVQPFPVCQWFSSGDSSDLAFSSVPSRGNVEEKDKNKQIKKNKIARSAVFYTLCSGEYQNISFIHMHQITSNLAGSKLSNMN